MTVHVMPFVFESWTLCGGLSTVSRKSLLSSQTCVKNLVGSGEWKSSLLIRFPDLNFAGYVKIWSLINEEPLLTCTFELPLPCNDSAVLLPFMYSSVALTPQIPPPPLSSLQLGYWIRFELRWQIILIGPFGLRVALAIAQENWA